MSTPNTARATKRWKLRIGSKEYQGHTSAIEYNANDSGSVWKGGDDNTIADVTPGDPSISISMAQDSANPQSLWRLLFDAPVGTPMTLEWNPHYDDAFAVGVDFKSVRPPLQVNRAGGVPEVTVQLPCSAAVPVPVSFTLQVTGSPTGGTYKLAINGQESATIAHNADATAVQSALNAIDDGITGITVTGTTTKTITLPGAHVLTGDGSALTGGTTPAVVIASS